MKNSKLKDIAELIGLAAIVASLVFVGLQIELSRDLALANQYQARAEATMNLSLAQLEANYLGPIPALQAGITEEVSRRDVNLFLWLWTAMDNHYYQYQVGFLAEDSWQAQLRNIKGIYANCPMRFVYDWSKRGHRSEFVTLVESLNDPCS